MYLFPLHLYLSFFKIRFNSIQFNSITSKAQQYAYSLAKLHKEEERIHEEEKMKLKQHIRRRTRISGVIIPGPQQNKRVFAGMIRWLITFPTARKRTKNNPIGKSYN